MSVTLEDLKTKRMNVSATSPERSMSVEPSPPIGSGGPLENRNFRIGIIIAVLAVCVVGVALYTQSVGSKRTVLIVRRPVTSGHVLADADIGESRMSFDADVALIPSSERGQVINRIAAMALVPGAPLTFGQLSTGPRMNPGEVEVAMALKAGQVPPSIHSDDHVSVIRVAGVQSAGDGSNPADPVVVQDARVASYRPASDTSPDNVVSLFVAAASAPSIAQAAAAGQIALVRIGGS